MIHQALSIRALGAAALLGLALPAFAAVLDESTAGDFSGDRLVPTVFLLDAATNGGDNLLGGRVGRVGGVVDRDYVTVVVPDGYFWTGLQVNAGTAGGGTGGSFIGLASGATMPVASDAVNASGLLGWTLFNAGNVGSDLLGAMAVPRNGSSGFAQPLAAGSYTLWAQELATGNFAYNFNLTVTPVPEPASALLMLLGLGTAAAAARRARRQARM